MLAGKFVERHEREELVQDTALLALRRWHLYKDTFAFTTWLGLQMKNVLSDRRAASMADKRNRRQADIDMTLLPVPAEQEAGLEIAEVLSAMPPGREGRILQQRLLGYEQKEIADELGLTRTRVQQLEVRGHQMIRQALFMRKMAAQTQTRVAA